MSKKQFDIQGEDTQNEDTPEATAKKIANRIADNKSFAEDMARQMRNQPETPLTDDDLDEFTLAAIAEDERLSSGGGDEEDEEVIEEPMPSFADLVMASDQGPLTKRYKPPVILSDNDKQNLQKYQTIQNSEFLDRLQNSQPLSDEAEEIDASLSKSIEADGERCPSVLYRAIKEIRAAQLGLQADMQFRNAAWQSATRSKHQAEMMSVSGTLFILNFAHQYRVETLDMSPYAIDKNKMEMVIPKNAIFSVVNIKDGNGDNPDIVTVQVTFPESSMSKKELANKADNISDGENTGESNFSTYMQSLINPKTKDNDGRFGADLILGLLAYKRRLANQ